MLAREALVSNKELSGEPLDPSIMIKTAILVLLNMGHGQR